MHGRGCHGLLFNRLHTLKVEQAGLLIGAARYLNEVYASLLQQSGHLQTLVKIKTAMLKIGAIEFDRDRHRRAYGADLATQDSNNLARFSGPTRDPLVDCCADSKIVRANNRGPHAAERP